MQIFLDDTDYRKFVYVLGDVVEEFELDCWNYCAMPNHYHATLRPTLPNLSAAIQKLNGVYGRWWNLRHGTVGHVFQGRFKAQLVQEDGYLETLCRYIALNPVRGGLAGSPAEWPWSSYAATVGLQPAPAFLALDAVLRHFGDGERQTLQTRFAEYVLGDHGEEAVEDRIRSPERILGEKPFKRLVTRSDED